MTIQELARLTLMALNVLRQLDVNGPTAYFLSRLAYGSGIDCIFFNNAGGYGVTVWEDGIAEILKAHPEWVYAYRLKGKEVIFKRPLPSPDNSYLYWITLDTGSEVGKMLEHWASDEGLAYLLSTWEEK